MTFYQKYLAITKAQETYVCVGLDSDPLKLPQTVLHEANPVLAFNMRIIDETHRYVAAYKPNFAFYIAQGALGVETLAKTCEYIPPEIPIIIDIKAGDIGNTMQQYATAFFTHLRADAITINMLMGADVVEACLSVERSFAFALAITSNPSASDFFKHDGLDSKIAEAISGFPADRLGAVVGATQTSDLARMRQLMPEHIFLIPGVGAQGGSVEAVCRYAAHSAENPLFLINSSRGVIYADSAEKEVMRLRDEVNRGLIDN